MKRNAIVCALVAMSLGLGGPVFAQGDGDPAAQREAKRQVDRSVLRHDQRGYQRHGPRDPYPQAQYGDRHAGERGAGPEHRFYRGDRLPPEYRHHSYVVEDWRGHHLSAPPRGYQWVQTGSDYVLVAIATGIILQILLNNN